MFIAKMTIKEDEAPPFGGRVEFAFDEHVNVFVGPNASGKTTVLRQLLNNYRIEWASGSARHTSKPEPFFINSRFVHRTDSEHCAFALENDDADDHRNLRYDLIIIPASRVRYGQAPVKDGLITDNEDHDFFGVGSLSAVLYQDHIHSTISALQRTIQGNSIEDDAVPKDRAYSDYELIRFFEDPAKKQPELAGAGLTEALAVAYQCAKSICHEVVSGEKPEDRADIRNVESESGLPSAEVHYDLGVHIPTSDTRDGRRVGLLDMTSLSAGTEGTLWWTRLIALSLLFMNEFEPGWAKRRAILLIDEIENHLHPTWQRRVIPALLEHFPGLQIFATTHSPFVVAGLKAGQVHLLDRDENGVVTATTNTEHVVGWTADEILRVFMGVDDPTDKDTAEAAAALRKLRDEGPRVDEREEERRQSEIARLRQIVDRAELSGPRVAEDARFLADLESILERHRDSQELNQENG